MVADRVALALREREEIGVSSGAQTGLAFRAGALDQPAVRDALAALVARPVVAHDWKLLRAVLRAHGIADVAASSLGDDPMIAAHLHNPSRSYANADDAAS